MSKKPAKSKPQAAAARPRRPEDTNDAHEITTTHAAYVLAQAFLTRKVEACIDKLVQAAKAKDDAATVIAGTDLAEELRIANPEEWRRATGRELPRNVEELRALMAECGYSPDFISAGDWTPREVGPVLLKKLRPHQADDGGIPPTHRSRRMSFCEAGVVYRRGAGLPTIKRTKAGEYMARVVRDFEDDGKHVCDRGNKNHVFDIRIFAESERAKIGLNAP